MPTVAAMQRAVRSKDPAYDGLFFVAIRTTGIFCRPVCRAKPARLRNMEFFATAHEALCHGYRPCALCRPLDGGTAPPALVSRLMAHVETGQRLRQRDLLDRGIDPSTARRQFQRYCRMSFAAYQRARRMGAAMQELRRGHPVIRAQSGAGFHSASGFRAAFRRMFGTRANGAASLTHLIAHWLPTPLGPMVAVCSDDGIVLLDFLDRKGLESAIGRLRQRFATSSGPAVITPGDHVHLRRLAAELAAYFAGTHRQFTVPLRPRGTPFELHAWRYLQTIPFGQTRSYADEARALGHPRAVRAGGRANGMNYLAIVIPCHRVIASNGALTGYGGGLARKAWLLAHEQRLLPQQNNGVKHGFKKDV